VSALILAMQNSQALDTAKIIGGIPAEDRSNGESIRCAVDAARLLAITAAVSI
jgi:tRNA nucleotidyltransferase (CCA-adding enzyme)